jgi:4-alpha-glucanotransferase
MVERPRLRALADRAGILPSYFDLRGVQRLTSDATREALLAALGLDASSERGAAGALAELERSDRERLLAPVQVSRTDERAPGVRVRLPEDIAAPATWRLELESERGATWQAEGPLVRGGSGSEVSLALPGRPGPGYHRLRLTLASGDRVWEAEQLLVLTPGACLAPGRRLGGRRVFGICANLYTLRSRRNWGAGDLTDLRELVRWSGEVGAAFVGINPLHTLRNRGWEVSPYNPVSRLFRNALYLDVEEVPELAECDEARGRLASRPFREALARLRQADLVQYEALTALKRPLCAALHRTFAHHHRGRDTTRGRSYAAFLAREGEVLENFATFLTLEERFAGALPGGGGWRTWPAPYRDPRSPEVVAFRRANLERVDFHRWLQFELDRQLAEAAALARRGGLALGLYNDLALGTAPGGSDPWAFPGLFLEGVGVGAPPDDFSRTGQDWGLPPLHPRRMAADGYRYWIRLLRAAFAHAGVLRVDHVMGLFRQFWIPAGRPGTEGAYVRYPGEDLLGILALESRRHDALVVGEDLGTVPEGLRPVLRRRGLLSSRVLYFEQDRPGFFRASSRYPRRSLVTANTHDLPPLAGYWEGRDLALRREAGQIVDDDALREALSRRRHERQGLLRRLAREGLLPHGEEAPERAELCAAVNAFLCQTPGALAGIALDDLAGETEPVNLPGVGMDRYASWSRRMRLSLEELPSSAQVARALAGTRGRRPPA